MARTSGGRAILRRAPAAVRQALHDMLGEDPAAGSSAEAAARKKTVMILMRTWVSPPEDLRAMCRQGRDLVRRLPVDQYLPVHWGMVMAAYPYFHAVTAQVGRLLRLRENAGAVQVQRRLQEDLGDRQIVARAGRHVLRSLVDFGALCDTAEKGIYGRGARRPIDDPELTAWVVEAVLSGGWAQSAPLTSLLQSPALFPFVITRLPASALEAAGRLDVSRQSLDQDVVAMRGMEAGGE